MDEAREAEIRALAARFMAGTKHHRIGLVLDDLLDEIDYLRGDLPESHMSYTEAIEALERFAATHQSGNYQQGFAAAVRAKAHLYARP